MSKKELKEIKKELDAAIGDTNTEILADLLKELKNSPLSQEHLKTIREYEEKLMMDGADVKALLLELVDQFREFKLEIPEQLKVWVENPIPAQKFPKAIKVSNLKEIKPEKFPEIKIPDTVEIKESKWLTRYIQPVINTIGNGFESLKQVVQKVDVTNRRPNEAVAVRLVDKRGKKFVDPSGGGGVFGTWGAQKAAAVKETVPTDNTKNNASFSLSYTGSNLTQVDMNIGGTVFRKTLSYTGDNLTSVSRWVQV